MAKNDRSTLNSLFVLVLAATGCDSAGAWTPQPAQSQAQVQSQTQTEADSASLVERGRYLVSAGGCEDCHTPMMMTPQGPERDQSRLLSGHPEGMAMPPAPELPPGPWIGVVGATMTAWAGPWGTSFTANLTPDPETGLGSWTARNFIDTIRTGRHMGRGRPLLPPMPVDVIANYTDEDLTAMFAYLQSIPAVKNRVPVPLPPSPAAVPQEHASLTEPGR